MLVAVVSRKSHIRSPLIVVVVILCCVLFQLMSNFVSNCRLMGTAQRLSSKSNCWACIMSSPSKMWKWLRYSYTVTIHNSLHTLTNYKMKKKNRENYYLKTSAARMLCVFERFACLVPSTREEQWEKKLFEKQQVIVEIDGFRIAIKFQWIWFHAIS